MTNESTSRVLLHADEDGSDVIQSVLLIAMAAILALGLQGLARLVGSGAEFHVVRLLSESDEQANGPMDPNLPVYAPGPAKSPPGKSFKITQITVTSASGTKTTVEVWYDPSLTNVDGRTTIKAGGPPVIRLGPDAIVRPGSPEALRTGGCEWATWGWFAPSAVSILGQTSAMIVNASAKCAVANGQPWPRGVRNHRKDASCDIQRQPFRKEVPRVRADPHTHVPPPDRSPMPRSPDVSPPAWRCESNTLQCES